MPREKTIEEVQRDFLGHVWDMIDYWEKESRAETPRAKLEGLAHSLLAALDGCSMELPGFAVIPNPHPDDKAWCIERGEDWYPDDVDIGGELASLLFVYKHTNAEAKDEK